MKRKFRLDPTACIYSDDIALDDYGTNLPNASTVAELKTSARDNALTNTIETEWRELDDWLAWYPTSSRELIVVTNEVSCWRTYERKMARGSEYRIRLQRSPGA